MSRDLEPAPPPDKAFVRDYSHWWTLPPPLHPPLPLAMLALLAVVAAIIVLSLIAGVLGQDLEPKH